MSGDASGVHLIVLQHGLWGKSENLNFLEKLLSDYAAKHGHSVRVLNSNVNEGTHTYDGVDLGGDRVVQLIKNKAQALADEESLQVTKLTLIGYSLGGLIMRYAVGKLEREGAFASRFTPMNFITIASPHLGAWRMSPPDTSCIGRTFNSVYHDMVPVISSMTGYQLMLKDQHAFDRPLLLNMCDPALPFFQGLDHFQQRMCLANIRFDNMVPYRSAAIVRDDPYLQKPGIVSADPVKYPSVVRPSNDPEASPPGDIASSGMPMLFLCLLPIMFPILLVVLCVMSVKGRKHYCRSSELRKDMSSSWLERQNSNKRSSVKVGNDLEAPDATQPLDVSDYVLGRVESIQHTIDITQARTFEKQNWMVERLNKLDWVKVDVNPSHRRAHAAIVVRIPKQCSVCDHLEYMMNQMKW